MFRITLLVNFLMTCAWKLIILPLVLVHSSYKEKWFQDSRFRGDNLTNHSRFFIGTTTTKESHHQENTKRRKSCLLSNWGQGQLKPMGNSYFLSVSPFFSEVGNSNAFTVLHLYFSASSTWISCCWGKCDWF